MTPTRGQVYFEKAQTLTSAYKLGDDPRPLQFAFAGLFDEAAQTICRAGSDLDEVLIERIFIVSRNHESEFEIPAEFLSDAELLRKSVLGDINAADISSETNAFEIVGVKIIARHDELAG
jgi:hypothetical protein